MGNVTFPVNMGDSSRYRVGFEFQTFHESQRHLFFEGKFLDYKTYGTLHEKMCVVKVKSDDPAMTVSLWNTEMNRSRQAEEIVKVFKTQLPGVSIYLNPVYPVQMDETSQFWSKVFGRSRAVKENEWVLVSPYIGEVSELGLNHYKHAELEALSHFSWQVSNGEILLGDFKGKVKDGTFYLLPPTIHSRQRQYGVKDLGQNAIHQFFERHLCTNLCQFMAHPVVASKKEGTVIQTKGLS